MVVSLMAVGFDWASEPEASRQEKTVMRSRKQLPGLNFDIELPPFRIIDPGIAQRMQDTALLTVPALIGSKNIDGQYRHQQERTDVLLY
jgi:hypothetical protein